MAAKGTVAKENLIKRFATAVGSDYIGTEDGKKYYFWSIENGERIQVAITLTVPKTPIAAQSDNISFEDNVTAVNTKGNAQMDEDEKATLERLMKELDL